MEILTAVLEALSSRPYTTLELCKFTKFGRLFTKNHINYLMEYDFVRKIDNTDYFMLKGKTYNFDLSPESPITNIPEYMFREIPIISRWHGLLAHIPKQNQHISDFKNVCYGKVVPGFTIHPAKWKYPKSCEDFYIAYKKYTNKVYMPENIVKAIRQFLTVCLDVKLPPKSQQAKMLGLIVNNSKRGQYRYVKLTPVEMQQAVTFLESQECLDLAKQVGLEIDRVKGHFSYTTEGFGRPSRVLTIEAEKVEKHTLEDGRTYLFWKQLETKQDREYPKMMWDQKLVSWASHWVDKRILLGYKYLFVDDNKYVPEKYDSVALAPERAKYTAIYKKLFEKIGKMKDIDSIYNNDTLYAFRHIGVKMWVDRLGWSGIVAIKTMGWESMDTLLNFYAGMEAIDVHNFIIQGNFKGMNSYTLK